MKKVLLSVAAVLALSAAPAFAADMPVKAVKAPVAAPSPWDVAFGTAFTTDYELRGITQSNHKPAAQGYFELDYTAADWVKFYAGVWGSSLATGEADAEFDISGGARFSFGNFGLDVGYVYYGYPDGAANLWGSYGEFYAKPSYKIADWLTIGAVIDGGNNFNDKLTSLSGSPSAYYYSGNAVITLPASLIPGPVTVSINPEIGRQVFDYTPLPRAVENPDYTYWDVGLDFNYRAVTLDLRYWDTNAPSTAYLTPSGTNAADSRFVATLKFDTSLSALK
jgi:uncharacterized protein (TIGR02001 family)